MTSAQALLVYAAIPPSTSIEIDGDTITLDTGEDVVWDRSDSHQVEAMVRCNATSRRTMVSRAGAL